MGQRGPLPQPDNVRLIRGTAAHNGPAKPRPRAVPAIPDAPQLDDEAKAEWARVAPELKRLGLLSNLDRAALTVYADAWSRWWAVAQDDEAKPIERQRVQRTFLDAAREVGLTPNARMRMRAPEADEDAAGLD